MSFMISPTENSSLTILGRITARNGSGVATGVDGEGNWLQVADISTIECAVYDRDGSTPNVAISTPVIAVASVVLDVPVETNVIWTVDDVGYNFIHDLDPDTFPEPDRRYEVEYKITLTNGAIFYGLYKGQSSSIRTD